MGLLILGQPYKWPVAKVYRSYIKKHGIKQFLNVWNLFKNRFSDVFLWGDEIEGVVLSFDHRRRKVCVSLRADTILHNLNDMQANAEKENPGSAWNVSFQPEYGNYMVEVTPGTPYGSYTSDLRMVEPNMRLRRTLVQSQLRPNEAYVLMTNYPLLGVDGFSEPSYPTHGPVLRSSYLPDQVMSPHPRFAALSCNIRRRRGKRVNIKVPLFKDVHTRADSAGNVLAVDERPELRAREDEIHMDAMAFGMGCCCLQVTFQTRSIEEARHLYDQQAVLAPLLLALSANTPVHRGRLADTDVRWDVISQSVDDRTEQEMGLPPREKMSSGAYLDSEKPLSPSPPNSPRQERVPAELALHAGTVAGVTDPVAGVSALAESAVPGKASVDDVLPLRQCQSAASSDMGRSSDMGGSSNNSHGSVGIGGSSSEGSGAPDAYSAHGSVAEDEHVSVGRRVDPIITAEGEVTPYRLFKSRYSSVDCYISRDRHYRDRYNDLPFAFDGPTYDTLREAGVDALLARHVASLFTRDPLVVFEGKVEVDDRRTTEHWESIQSTNWRSVRFKPPPLDGPVGWRVEFRTMEIQASDFENAAFTVFITLLSRAISFFDLNFYIPLSLVDKNFAIAHRNDACRKEMFFFRNRVRSCRRKSEAKTSLHSDVLHRPGIFNSPESSIEAGIPKSFEYTSVHARDGVVTTTSSLPCVGAWETAHNGDYEPEPYFDAPATAILSPDTGGNGNGNGHDNGNGVDGDASGNGNGADDGVSAHATSNGNGSDNGDGSGVASRAVDTEYELMSMRQVMCGKCYDADQQKCFPGLIPIVRAYLDIIACDVDTRAVVNRYLAFLEARAKDHVLTGAQWMRALIHSHPAYRAARDSVVSHEVMYDVARVVDLLGKGVLYTCELTGGWDRDASVHAIDMDHPPANLPFRPSPSRPLCLSRVRLDCPLVQELIELSALPLPGDTCTAVGVSSADTAVPAAAATPNHRVATDEGATAAISSGRVPVILPPTREAGTSPTSKPTPTSSSAITPPGHGALPSTEQPALTAAQVPARARIPGSLQPPLRSVDTLPAEAGVGAIDSQVAYVGDFDAAQGDRAGPTLTKSQAQRQLLAPHGSLMAGRRGDYTAPQYAATQVAAKASVASSAAGAAESKAKAKAEAPSDVKASLGVSTADAGSMAGAARGEPQPGVVDAKKEEEAATTKMDARTEGELCRGKLCEASGRTSNRVVREDSVGKARACDVPLAGKEGKDEGVAESKRVSRGGMGTRGEFQR